METTPENKIEILRKKAIEAAQNYVKTRCLSETSEVMDVSFLAGAKWALSHQWISVKDKLPLVEKSIGEEMWSMAVLVRTPKGGVYIDKYVFHHETWLNNGNFVSYWMPFPEFSEE